MDYNDIKKLMDEMSTCNIEELNIEFPEGMKISMKKNLNSNTITNKQTKIEEKEIKIENLKNEDIEENLKIVKSPMVGTFYESATPTAKPFVKVGDKVKKGQVLCIIEAMKLMNELESEYDGEIVEICVENEDIVDYGMPLFKIK